MTQPPTRLRCCIAPELLRSSSEQCRCWFVPPTDAQTVQDVAAALVHDLNLHAPSSALRISMEGFVVPHHMPANCFRDGDVLTVHLAAGVKRPAGQDTPQQCSKRAKQQVRAPAPAVAGVSQNQQEAGALAADMGGTHGLSIPSAAPSPVVAPAAEGGQGSDSGAPSARPSRSARRKAAKRKLRRLGVLPYKGHSKNPQVQQQKQKQGQKHTRSGAQVEPADAEQGAGPSNAGAVDPAAGGRAGVLVYAAAASPLNPNGNAFLRTMAAEQPHPLHLQTEGPEQEQRAILGQAQALTPAGKSERAVLPPPRSAPAKPTGGPRAGAHVAQDAAAGGPRAQGADGHSSSSSDDSSEGDDSSDSGEGSSSSDGDSSSEESSSSSDDSSEEEGREAAGPGKPAGQGQKRGQGGAPGVSGQQVSLQAPAGPSTQADGNRAAGGSGAQHASGGTGVQPLSVVDASALEVLHKAGLSPPSSATLLQGLSQQQQGRAGKRGAGAAGSSGAGMAALPALQGSPQVGAVLCYTLLEVGPDFTPRVSEPRLGRVAEWDSATGSATLAPWPDTSVHPLSSHIEEWVQRQKALMGEEYVLDYASTPFAERYGEDGTAEVEVPGGCHDVRLVWPLPAAASGSQQQQQQGATTPAPGAAPKQQHKQQQQQGAPRPSQRGPPGSNTRRQGGQQAAAPPPTPPAPAAPGGASRGPPQPGAPRVVAAVGAWAEVAEQLRARRAALTQGQGPSVGASQGSVTETAHAQGGASVPASASPAPPGAEGVPLQEPQGATSSERQGGGSTGSGAGGAGDGGPGRIKPRGGARRGALGPVLRMLRARAPEPGGDQGDQEMGDRDR